MICSDHKHGTEYKLGAEHYLGAQHFGAEHKSSRKQAWQLKFEGHFCPVHQSSP